MEGDWFESPSRLMDSSTSSQTLISRGLGVRLLYYFPQSRVGGKGWDGAERCRSPCLHKVQLLPYLPESCDHPTLSFKYIL